MVRLLSSVSDDSGEVGLIEYVKQGRRTVATIRRGGFVSASGTKTVATLWRVPAKAAGAYQHCVRATDRAGNASALSCAKVAIR
jgi:hypothetical protein